VARRLKLRLGVPVQLEFTDNTYTMVSFVRQSGHFRLRLHHMFREAPEGVLQALATFVRGGNRQASARLDAFIEHHRALIRQIPAVQRQRRLALRVQGQAHDLQALLDEVSGQFFGEAARGVAIAWAPAPRVRLPRRSIKLGSYSADTQVIRIHPALDQAVVPTFFLRWIIFHELLHHLFRADLQAHNGRVHTPEFNQLERQFPEYPIAQAWERRYLEMLLWWQPRPAVPLAAARAAS
jgi:hypothetical protein